MSNATAPVSTLPYAIALVVRQAHEAASTFERWAAEDAARGIERAASNREYAERERVRVERIVELWGVLEAAIARGEGLELAGANGERFAVLMPEPGDEAGRWRYQRFDAMGFSGHFTSPGAAEALVGAVTEGYVTECAGTLERLAAQPAWAIGCRIADFVQQVNEGRISHEEGARQVAPLREQLRAVTAPRAAAGAA